MKRFADVSEDRVRYPDARANKRFLRLSPSFPAVIFHVLKPDKSHMEPWPVLSGSAAAGRNIALQRKWFESLPNSRPPPQWTPRAKWLIVMLPAAVCCALSTSARDDHLDFRVESPTTPTRTRTYTHTYFCYYAVQCSYRMCPACSACPIWTNYTVVGWIDLQNLK